jgi:hypothetical protein
VNQSEAGRGLLECSNEQIISTTSARLSLSQERLALVELDNTILSFIKRNVTHEMLCSTSEAV